MQYAGPHSRKRDVYGVAVRLDPWFVTGLTVGEGCFCVSIAIRPKMKVGLEARPSFSLSLNERDRDLLGGLQAFFECGWIRESRSDRTFKYEVRSVPELSDRIVPHFEAYPLRGAKRHSWIRRGLPDDRTRRSSETGGNGRHSPHRDRDEPREAPALCRHTPTDAQ